MLGGYAALGTVAALAFVSGLLGDNPLQLSVAAWMGLSLVLIAIRRATMPELHDESLTRSLGFDGWAPKVIIPLGIALLASGFVALALRR